MAKQSKYVSYEGKRVNEVSEFKVPNAQNFLITKFEREKRECKGKRGYYYSYKLQLENGVWLSTQTFNKYVKRGFFSKQVVSKVLRCKEKFVFKGFDNNDLPLVDVRPTDVLNTTMTHYLALLDDKPKAKIRFSKLADQKLYEEKFNEFLEYDEYIALAFTRTVDGFHHKWLEYEENMFFKGKVCDIDVTEKTTQDVKNKLAEEDFVGNMVKLFYDEYKFGGYNCKTKKANERRKILNTAYVDAYMIFSKKFTHDYVEKLMLNRLEENLIRNKYKRSTGFMIVTDFNEYDDMFIQLDGNVKEIRALYKKLSKQLHPDMSTGNEEKFKQMSNAYERALANC